MKREPYQQIPLSTGTEREQEPLWKKALNVFAWPFEKVEEYLFKPVLATGASALGITPNLERLPDENWLNWKKREWEEWDDPSIGLWFKSPTTGEQAQLGIKGAAEMAPWFLLPGVGWAGRGAMAGKAAVAGRGIAGALSRVAPKLGELAPVVKTAAKVVEYSPWGVAEKSIGIAGQTVKKVAKKAILGRVEPQLTKSGAFFDAPSNEAIDALLTKNDYQRVVASWFGRKPVSRILAKLVGGEAALVKGTEELEDITTRALLTGVRIEESLLNQRAAGMATLRTIHPDPVKLFGVDEITGIAGKVKTTGVMKNYMPDVLENPSKFILSAEQKNYINEVHRIEDLVLKALQNENIAVNELKLGEFAHWVHRVVTGRMINGKYVELKKGGYGRIGSKQSWEKTRFYETAADGIENGIVYSGNPEHVLDLYIRSAAKKISDNRVAQLLTKYGALPSERLAEKFPGKLAAGIATTKQLAGAKHLVNVLQRAARGEKLTGATIAAQERRFPGIGKQLKAMMRGPSEKPSIQPKSWEDFKADIFDKIGVKVVDEPKGSWHKSGYHSRGKTEWIGVGLSRLPKNVEPENFKKLLLLHEAGHASARVSKEGIGTGIEAEVKAWKWTAEHAAEYGVDLDGAINIIKKAHPELGKGAIVEALVPEKNIADILKIHGQHSGSTYNISQSLGDLSKKPFYAVSAFKNRTLSVTGKNPSKANIQNYIYKNMDLLGKKEYSLGTWYDEATGMTDIDVVLTIKDRTQAALIGRGAKQKAMFDLAKMEEISLGYEPLIAEAKGAAVAARSPYLQARTELKRAREIARTPSYGTESTIMHPAFQGRIFPKEIADRVESYFADRGFAPLKKAAEVSGAMRTLVAAADFSAMFIQGLPMIARHPVAWAKGASMSFRAFQNPQKYQQYLAKEALALNERAFYGGYVGGFEMAEAVPTLQKIAKTVAGKRGETAIHQTYGRFEASFGSFGDVARNEMWKSMKGLVKNESELQELARHLDRMTGVMSSKGLGIGRTQRDFEQAFLFFAPRYTRAGIAFIGDMFKGGLTGNETRKALASLAVAGSAAYAGTALALGQEPNFDPSTGRFMTVKITDPITGADRYFGIGGMMTSLIRLGADVVSTTVNNPEDLFIPLRDGELNRADNPFIKFMYSKSSPLTGFMTGMITGKNYFGEPFENAGDYAKYMGEQVLPISLQSMLMDEGGITTTGLVGEQLGLRTFPTSKVQQRNAIRDEIANEKYGMSWNELAGKGGPGKIAQLRLETSSPELQSITEEAREYASKLARGEGKVWIGWQDEGKTIEKRYQNAIRISSAEYGVTYDGTKFRNDVAEAGDIRRAMYDARDTNPAYEEIKEYFDENITPRDAANMNELDLARREYYKLMYSKDMYDQYGNYSFDKAEIVEEAFVTKYGNAALQYVKEYSGAKWEETGPLKALKEAQKILKPYWKIEDYIWSKYPPEARELYAQILLIENRDKASADRLLKRYPQLVRIRAEIAKLKKLVRESNPEIKRALDLFYS